MPTLSLYCYILKESCFFLICAYGGLLSFVFSRLAIQCTSSIHPTNHSIAVIKLFLIGSFTFQILRPYGKTASISHFNIHRRTLKTIAQLVY